MAKPIFNPALKDGPGAETQAGQCAAVAPAVHRRLLLWLAKLHLPPAKPELLAGDGGRRKYYRLKGTGRLALAGPDPSENLAWLRIGRHLWFKGLPLPRILDGDLRQGLFLLEDLGDQQLAGYRGEDLYYQAVELAARLHVEGLDGFNPGWCHQSRRYDAALAERGEIAYFLEYLVRGYLGQSLPPKGLRDEVRALAASAASGGEKPVLMHRDFQGRNLMIFKGRLQLLDWQGARLGPAVYDLSSLMEETPGRRLDEGLKEELLKHYLKVRRLSHRLKFFQREMALVGAVRMMQALGAYGRLSLEGKGRFASYIPPALERLAEMFRRKPLKAFPVLRAVIEEARLSKPLLIG